MEETKEGREGDHHFAREQESVARLFSFFSLLFHSTIRRVTTTTTENGRRRRRKKKQVKEKPGMEW